MIEKIAQYRKAIAAFLVPGLLVLGTSLIATSDGGTAITAAEWVSIVIAMLGTGTVVTVVPNAITARQEQDIAKHVANPEALASELISEANRRAQ